MPARRKITHLNYAITPKTHTSMYLMHKYWARKPHNVVAKYIEAYSRKGDVVLDPFVGSGVTAIEALKLGRKAIATDLDPMSIFITKMTIEQIDLKKFEKQFKRIEDKIKPKINPLYQTSCIKCGKKAFANAYIWEDGIPKLVRYKCTCSKRNLWKKISRIDKQIIKKIEKGRIPFWIPKNELIWNTRVNVHKGDKVSGLFTKRSLIVLSRIYREIELITDEKIRNILKFTFSSALPQASKMVFVIRKRGRLEGEEKESKPEVGSWATRGYWVPSEHFEINAWNCFENRFKKIMRGKKESNEKVPPVKIIESYKELTKKSALIKTHNALELMSLLPEESVDYVFTDPPYGDSVPYLELNYMWASWMKFPVNFDDEIIISDSPTRKEKNLTLYEKMLNKAFRQIYRVLKKNRYLTVTFHNTDIKIYNSIISSVILSGFDLERIVYQPPARASPKGLLAPYGSAVGDYYIRFKKTKRKSLNLSAFSEMDKERYEKIIIKSVKKIIGESGEPTPFSTITNSYPLIYNELKKNGFLFSAPEGIENILKRNIEKEFVLIDVKNKKGKLIGKKWWLKGVLFLDRVPLSERVEAITLNVLNKEIKVTFDEVLKQVYLRFTNALTPNTENVKEALEEFAQKTKDGRWRIRTEIKQRDNEHDSIVEMIAIIGKKAGFNVYADLSGWRGRLDLKIPKAKLNRIKEIDVIWYKKGEISHEFEVENTTGITEAIVRGSNIEQKNIKRYIVIPEERMDFFYQKISEPILEEKVTQYNWRFIYYDALKGFFSENKNKKSINEIDFEKMSGKPKLKIHKQQNISEFNR